MRAISPIRVAARDPAWSPDGKWISWFSDSSGEYQLIVASQDGTTKRAIALTEPSHYYTPEWSPDAKHILFHDTHLRLWVLDVASGKATHVDTDPYMMPDRSLDPRFSPDGRWIAYARRLPSMFRAIFVYNVETGAKHQLTDGLADATSPRVGCERQVSLVPREHQLRAEQRLARHVELRSSGDEGALSRRVEEG